MRIGCDQTLSGWLRIHAETRPDAPALIDADGVMTYSQLAAAAGDLSAGFSELGIGKGDVVGAQLPNVRTFAVSLLAAASRGAVFLTLHMPYRKSELSNLLADSKARAVIVPGSGNDGRGTDVMSLRPGLPDLEHVIFAGQAPPGSVSVAELMDGVGRPADGAPVSADDEYLLLYTSGTTAAPKGVPHTYRRFLNNAFVSAREMRIDSASRILSLAPMTHLYGLFTLHMSLAAGAASVLIPTFNPETVLADLQDSRASHIFAAPAHFAPFVAQKALNSRHLAAARILCLSGAAVPRELAGTIDSLMPEGRVVQLWGMSELQAGTFGRPDDPKSKRISTAGAAVPQTELRIVGSDGSVLPAGEEGALQVRGPSVFAGYLRRPEETEAAFDDNGWFRTGDLASIDADGFLKIAGRTKEIINRGGVKYNPAEVEEILLGLPQIQQCAVVPVPDETLGERGCLCAELTPGSALTLEDAAAALDDAGIAKYKWPERLAILDRLPMTPTRKVMRGKLLELIQNQKD